MRKQFAHKTRSYQGQNKTKTGQNQNHIQNQIKITQRITNMITNKITNKTKTRSKQCQTKITNKLKSGQNKTNTNKEKHEPQEGYLQPSDTFTQYPIN